MYNVRFDFLCLSETFPILRITERDITINVLYAVLHVKYPIFLSDCDEI